MNAAQARAERRFRRLLWAYPGPYRRRHGVEIFTTLMDMAESGYEPTLAQRLHLVACGIRQRFRLPVRRPFAVLAAVLAAIALGAVGSAGGTWLGWRTATSVPSGDQIRTLTVDMLGATPAQADVFPWETAMNGPVVASRALTPAPYPGDRVRAALTSAGWRIVQFTETREVTSAEAELLGPAVVVPQRSIMFRATKDGLKLTGFSQSALDGVLYGVDVRTDARFDVWAVDTAAVVPCTVAGLLTGALAGWLLVAALTTRVRQAGRAHRTTVAMLGVTATVAAAAPVFALYCKLYQVLGYDSGAPNAYIESSPSAELPAYLVPAGTAIGLVALAAVVVIAARGARTATD
ncbi:hypothetical protein EV385_4080 [Krasilnikovia cinnamomea]|uniref:Uncharacterized protein n=1 Tax=Krasilnikovia cinnamomea TaxID=349313 RepID=A0A4Q7ZP01_9ACTN|nr:hypothetical protein [Krasilnikovia cinnamomea]RZU52233.1 hypothetical protein EV385_4080 [Krasilnikovia cinnamomea]